MESDLLTRQDEVGGKGEYDVSRRITEILFWDVMEPNEVVLESNEVLLKRPAVGGSGKRQPVGHKRRRKCMRTNKASTSKKLEQKCKLHDPKVDGPSKEVNNQDQQAAPMLKMGMTSFKLRAYWRAPDSDICYVCGQDGHSEQFCTYNYIYGLYDQDPCKADCFPGQHKITSAACGKFLRCVIRVNNMPPSFCTSELLELFKPFGPLLLCDARRVSGVCRAYGVVIFKERGDGERAIDKINGYLVGNNKLRVDWAYPFVPSGSKPFPFISMTRAGRRREKREIAPTTEMATKRIFKKRGGGKQGRAAGFLFPKIQRFLGVAWNPTNRQEWLSILSGLHGATRRVIWIFFMASSWAIWKTRNKFTIEHEFPKQPADCIFKSMLNLQQWRPLQRLQDGQLVDELIALHKQLFASTYVRSVEMA